MQLRINGAVYALDLPPHATLLDALRDGAHFTGTKLVCGRGECGACTVLVDGAPAYACLTLAAACGTADVLTIEGLARDGALHPLQDAFIRHDALQCGFCTPGQIMSALALLHEHPDPQPDDVIRWMSGNLCRCGAYPKIVRAVLDAAARMREHDGQA